MSKKVSLAKFQSMLLKHNWSYYLSNSSIAWDLGMKSKKEIQKVLETQPEFTSVYEEYRLYVEDGGPCPGWSPQYKLMAIEDAVAEPA